MGPGFRCLLLHAGDLQHLSLRARVTPDGYFGRITSIAGVVGQVANGISMAWLGLALRLAHGPVTFIALGAGLLALAACAALLPAPPLPTAAQDTSQTAGTTPA